MLLFGHLCLYLYLPYIAEYVITIIEEKTAKKFGKELKEGYKIALTKRNGAKYLVIVMIICVLTGLVTPLGTTPYTYLVKTMQGNTTQNINEHLPMTLVNCVEVLCALIIFIALLTFTDIKIRLVDLFMLGGLILLMLYSKRQSTMFVIMCSIILNRLVYEFISKDGKDIDEKYNKCVYNIVWRIYDVSISVNIKFVFCAIKNKSTIYRAKVNILLK